jgi:hypothetical protein
MDPINDVAKTFRTKTGFCHIFPDRIVISRSGFVGDMAKVVVGNNISRILIVYFLVACLALYKSYKAYQTAYYFGVAIWLALSIYLLVAIYRSRKNSATSTIFRNTIQHITFKPAAPGLTRACFIVKFTENDKQRQRLIMLPGSLTGGADETEKALQIIKEEGLFS